MPERITIKDIAKALNIHHSTVSRALRNDKRVKEATRNLVNDYALKYGYQTNRVALELRGEKRNMVAVIVPNINHQFFSNIVSHFTNYASDSGFVVSVFQTNENYEREKNIIDTIIQNNFSGVVASISMESNDTYHFNKLKQYNIPLVMFDRVSEDINVPKVLINNVEIMQEAVSLLVNRGYKKIAHISGSDEINVFSERQRGYKMAVSRLGLGYEKIISIKRGFTIEDGKLVADELWGGQVYPNAIICDSSNLIFGLIRELKSRRLNIPKDVALIAFGDNPVLEIVEPAITCIIQPDKEIAQKTFELLLKKIKHEKSSITTTVMLSAIIAIRESI